MLFKTKAGVQSAVDPFHRSPVFVFPGEFIAAAVNRVEYTVICLQRYPNTTLTGTVPIAGTLYPVYLDRTFLAQAITTGFIVITAHRMASTQPGVITEHLAFDFCGDKTARNVSDQYMFGPAFLVNPVTSPMYYGPGCSQLHGVKKSRTVYLPDGIDWVDFWTGKMIKGGRMIKAAAPLGIMPLFVKAGSIIPMGPVTQHTGEKPNAAIELRVYPGADGAFILYEDEGDGYNYETGAYAIIAIRWIDSARQLVVEDRQGEFDGMAAQKVFRIVLVSAGHGAGLEEAEASRDIDYSGKRMVVCLS